MGSLRVERACRFCGCALAPGRQDVVAVGGRLPLSGVGDLWLHGRVCEKGALAKPRSRADLWTVRVPLPGDDHVLLVALGIVSHPLWFVYAVLFVPSTILNVTSHRGS